MLIFRLSFPFRRFRRPVTNLRPWMRFRRALVKTGIYLVMIIVAHSLAMMSFEALAVGEAVWLTLTTLTTVGYGDISAGTFPGRAATVGLLYFGGIFVAAKMAGDYFEYRALKRHAMRIGEWKWDKMNGHIVIVDAKRETVHRLQRLVQEIDNHEILADLDVVLISTLFPDGLPPQLENMDVHLVRGSASDRRSLENAAVDRAAYGFILSWDEDEIASDARTFDVVHRFRESNPNITIVAETVDDQNRERLARAGADILLRPVKAYPEMLVAATVYPGTGEILENLFSAHGEQIHCHKGTVTGKWADVIQDALAKDLGLPIAYQNAADGRVVTAPPANTTIDAEALFVLIS